MLTHDQPQSNEEATAERQRAYQDGRDAFNTYPVENPHSIGSRLWYAWRDGFSAAEAAALREMNRQS